MRKTLLSLALILLAVALPVSALADTTNAPAKPGGLPPDLDGFLRNADTFILFSVDPIPDFEHRSTNTFCGHNIIGQLTIKRPETRTSLIEALENGISLEADKNTGIAAPLPDCFNPRHGIRAIKDDETIEFLICFECAQIQVSSNKGRSWFFMTDKKPAATFNGVLKRNHVPLPKD